MIFDKSALCAKMHETINKLKDQVFCNDMLLNMNRAYTQAKQLSLDLKWLGKNCQTEFVLKS